MVPATVSCVVVLFALIRLPAQTVAVGSYAALRPSLDELRWVIAHECAHIKHEDGLSRGLGMGLGLVAYHGVCVCVCVCVESALFVRVSIWTFTGGLCCARRGICARVHDTDIQAQRSCCGGDWVPRCTEGIPLQLCALLWSVLGRCW